jgi:hypothetical protein
MRTGRIMEELLIRKQGKDTFEKDHGSIVKDIITLDSKSVLEEVISYKTPI